MFKHLELHVQYVPSINGNTCTAVKKASYMYFLEFCSEKRRQRDRFINNNNKHFLFARDNGDNNYYKVIYRIYPCIIRVHV